MKVKIKRSVLSDEKSHKFYIASRYENKKLEVFSIMTTYKGK